MTSRSVERSLYVGLATVVAAGLALIGGPPAAMAKTTPAGPAATSTALPLAKTSAREAKRVDSVKTPKLHWYACYDYAQCATAKLPLDYDHPHGAKVEVALLRVRAKDQQHKVGSLFINPGGPGGSATELAYEAPLFLGADLLKRFDIVGLDPRGTNFSDQVTCFPSARQQTPVLNALGSVAFPFTTKEEKTVVGASKALGKACSTTGKPLSASMSTAQVARDMDVLRRSVGDKKLNYLGFSYGSYLGQVYANLFPDRFRALAIDGVVDPTAWAGTAATKNDSVWDRIRSADGATKALHEMLVRCDRAGGTFCSFSPGDPVANFDLVAERLKAKPLVDVDPVTGEPVYFGYADLISAVLGSLYSSTGYLDIDFNMSQLIILTEPPAKAGARARFSVQQRAAAMKNLRASLARARARTQNPLQQANEGAFGFPYDNSLEAFESVVCTDSLNPADASSWPAAAAAADRRAKYFGRVWVWNSSPCASKTWTAKDEDAYRGPFNRNTTAPVLIVGSLWDPATNYASAVKVASMLPRSRLLTSDNWGHTAYGTSSCATKAIDHYLLDVKLPAVGKRCKGDDQPFTKAPDDEDQAALRLQKLLVPPASTRAVPGRF